MITIVDYKAGNLTSVKRALDHLAIDAAISPDPNAIRHATRIIFPGVGHAATAMAVLRERGIDQALREAHASGTPILGICLGCQIVLGRSDEGDTECLGLVRGQCRKFAPKDPSFKIPHMGWNALTLQKPHPLLAGLCSGDELYFVHSYYPVPESPAAVYATTDHEIELAVAIGERNLFATQFHPEKSGRLGLDILRRFAAWDGSPC
jgi:imidazole glycerol-phosphate synthase subunit HisH